MSYWEKRGASDEWFTPSVIFEALSVRFDLDVAGCDSPHCTVPADNVLTQDGLTAEWSGFVWMNPPFGGRNGLQPWLERFFEHGRGIALTPDRTSAPWFRYAWDCADLVLFTPKLRFIRPNGKPGDSPSNGTTLWAAGTRARRALIRASDAGLGILGMPIFQTERAA